MRNLKKNQRTLYYASFIDVNPIKDEWGNDTLEVESIYGEPTSLKINYSPNVGEIDTQIFGNVTSYSRVLSFTGATCPLKEKDRLWINKEVTEDANYEVLKVADGLNSFLIAIGEIV